MPSKHGGPSRRRSFRVLLMVGELHKLGYQRLRIAPGTPSGLYWRCSITPITNILRSHGARMSEWSERNAAHYTSGQDNDYFGWTDANETDSRGLAQLFIERFPHIAEAGRGRDWTYAGWYVEMLGHAADGYFPIAYTDGELPDDELELAFYESPRHRRMPLPPPGEAVAVP